MTEERDILKRFFADSGEERVDSQEAGKLAVAKHTLHLSLLSPCILLILPRSGQAMTSLPRRSSANNSLLIELEPRRFSARAGVVVSSAR